MTTSKLRVGINGFGRTGRQFLRAWWERHRDNFDVVAINGRTPVEMHTHLLRYDSDYGRFPAVVTDGAGCFRVEGHEVHVFEEDDPAEINWGAVGVDVVVESTGAFRDRATAGQHLGGSVRKVIISAPGKDEDWMVIFGVNQDEYDPARHHVISAGSCTTNCVVPVVKVLHDAFGIERGMMTTIHAYTRDQNLVDSKHSDLRRARAAGLNIVPTSTGAASAVAQIVPELKGKLTGIAYRVPTPTVSVVDLATDLARPGLGGGDQRGLPGGGGRPDEGHPLRRARGAGLDRLQEPPRILDLRPPRDDGRGRRPHGKNRWPGTTTSTATRAASPTSARSSRSAVWSSPLRHLAPRECEAVLRLEAQPEARCDPQRALQLDRRARVDRLHTAEDGADRLRRAPHRRAPGRAASSRAPRSPRRAVRREGSRCPTRVRGSYSW